MMDKGNNPKELENELNRVLLSEIRYAPRAQLNYEYWWFSQTEHWSVGPTGKKAMMSVVYSPFKTLEECIEGTRKGLDKNYAEIVEKISKHYVIVKFTD